MINKSIKLVIMMLLVMQSSAIFSAAHIVYHDEDIQDEINDLILSAKNATNIGDKQLLLSKAENKYNDMSVKIKDLGTRNRIGKILEDMRILLLNKSKTSTELKDEKKIELTPAKRIVPQETMDVGASQLIEVISGMVLRFNKPKLHTSEKLKIIDFLTTLAESSTNEDVRNRAKEALTKIKPPSSV